MKTFLECRDVIALKWNCNTWEELECRFYGDKQMEDDVQYQVAELFAQEVAQDALNRAADNAETEGSDFWGMWVNKDSITETPIILP